MEDSDRSLLAPFFRNRTVHLGNVAHEAGIVVSLARVKGVAPTVADVVQRKVEPLKHMSPEWEVGIAREAVAVAQHHTWP